MNDDTKSIGSGDVQR